DVTMPIDVTQRAEVEAGRPVAPSRRRAPAVASRRMRWTDRALLALLFALAVTRATFPERPTVAAPPPPPPVRPLVEPVVVDVVVPAPPARRRWAAEAAGHVTVLLEAGLAEARGVVPRLAGVAPAPGLAGTVPAWGTPWRLSVDLALQGEV